jgi:hypothetical protein
MKNSLVSLVIAGALVLPASAATSFVVSFSGDQEVPSVVSSASGMGTLTLSDDESRLTLLLTFTGVDLDGAVTPGSTADDVTGLHFHSAPAGSNGGVVFGIINPSNDANGDTILQAQFGTVATVWDAGEGNGTTLTDQLVDLKAGNLYINVHTLGNPSGEIRGQVNPVTIPEPTAVFLVILGTSLVGFRRHRR